MASCEWALLCDYAFYDEGRKICLIGVFDRIFVQGIPATHNRAAFAMEFVGEPNESVQVRLEVVRPTGPILLRIDQEVVIGNNGRAHVIAGLANLPLPDHGIYAFNVCFGSQLAKTRPLIVEILRPGGEP